MRQGGSTRLNAVTDAAPARRAYSYLGPAGTFTEAALDQVPEARGQEWRAVHNVGEALSDVLEGRSDAAMIAIEIDADSHDALVFCDGRREMTVPAGGRLEVTKCGTPLKWVRLDSAPFTDRLVRKFRLPVTGWRGQ